MPNTVSIIYRNTNLKISLLHENVQFLLEDAQYGAFPNLNHYIFQNPNYPENFK